MKKIIITLVLFVSSVSSYAFGWLVDEIITKDGAHYYDWFSYMYAYPIEDAKKIVDKYDFYLPHPGKHFTDDPFDGFTIYAERKHPKVKGSDFDYYKKDFEEVINEVEGILRDSLRIRYNRNYKRVWATEGALKLTFDEYFERIKLYMCTTECLETTHEHDIVSYYLLYSMEEMLRQCSVGYKKKLGCCEEEMFNLFGYLWSGYIYTGKRGKVWVETREDVHYFTEEEIEQIKKENEERKKKVNYVSD